MHSHQCPFANASVSALGPCFVSPQAVKAQLEQVPAGMRAISLEGNGMYYLERQSPTSQQAIPYFMDTLPGGVQGPWFDTWAAALKTRFTEWFAEFARIGGTVDVVLSDFESGGQASYYAFPKQLPKGAAPAAMVADARWPALQERLNSAAAQFGKDVRFDDGAVLNMSTWTQGDWHGYIWNQVVVDTLLPRALNASMFEPIRAAFPSVQLSNFAHAHRSDPARLPSSLAGWWPHDFATSSSAPVGTGAHVGTAQSRGFYGGSPSTNTSLIMATATPQRQQSVQGSAFAALLVSTAVARDMALAAPGVAVQPWFAPHVGIWHECGPDRLQACGWSWLAASGGMNDTLWQENVFHVALETAAVQLLWWQPGSQKPIGIGLDELDEALQELEAAIAYACGDGRALGSGTPLAGLGASDTATWLTDGWARSYVLSGLELACDGGKKARLHRFTPRCLDRADGFSGYCSSMHSTHNGSKVTVRVGSGFEWSGGEGQNLWLPARPVSRAGWWLVTHPAKAAEA